MRRKLDQWASRALPSFARLSNEEQASIAALYANLLSQRPLNEWHLVPTPVDFLVEYYEEHMMDAG